MLTYNLKVVDGLTNGSVGQLYGIKVGSRNQLMEIHVHFFGKNVGIDTSKNFSFLKDKYGVPCIALSRYQTEFQLRKGDLSSSSTGTAIQFPLKLADAVTAHKVRKLVCLIC